MHSTIGETQIKTMIPKVVVGTEIKMKKLEIKDLLRVLRSKFWIVIAAVVICAALSFSYCAFLATPLYSSSAIIAVTTGGISNDDTETKNRLHYIRIIIIRNT